MSHVVDDLELYALGALPPERGQAVAAHLRSCLSCGAVAEELAEVVAALPDAIPPRDPPSRLKERILAAASADARRPRPVLRLPGIVFAPRSVAIAAALVLVAGIGAQAMQLDAARSEASEYKDTLWRVAHGGKTWYMAGIDQWRGTGGNLMQPVSGEPAFVLFHDLRRLPDGQLYALWLISADGKWVRGNSFRPDGREYQLVAVGQELAGFERCAVTVETSPAGKREGPIVMQSRIAPPAP